MASVATFAIEGIDSLEVTVEVDLRRGLPVFTLVGLPDAAVREARERVRAALLNSDLEFPLKRVTANLAPASLRKAGPSFDLALAVAVLAASGQVPDAREGSYAVCGELSLSGALRPVAGALAAAFGARRAGYERLIVPAENAAEAALVDGLEVLGVPDLARMAALLHGRWMPDPPTSSHAPRPTSHSAPDLVDVRGQADARRALEIAAAGGHNLLMVGPPGAGKTMIARRLPSILPPPSFEEALEITHVHSVAGRGDGHLASERPFRAPHHTISASGLVGGGAVPRPGEITLAHRGVLFLDELAEFSRAALEALRQPLEDGRVEIMRGQRDIAACADDARSRLQQLSVRSHRRRVRLQRRRPRAVRPAAERAAARPHRPRVLAGGRPRPRAGGRGRTAGRELGLGEGSGGRSTRASEPTARGHAGRLERDDGRVAHPRERASRLAQPQEAAGAPPARVAHGSRA